MLAHTFKLAASRTITELSEACERYEAYRDLVNLVKGRRIDAVVCRSRDRLGRTHALVATLERLCMDHNVVVIPRASLPPTIDPRLLSRSEGSGILAAVEASMAEAEIKRLVYRNEIGSFERVTKRKLFSRNPVYGYRYAFDSRGNPVGIEIDPEAAAVVRLVLVDLYADAGMSQLEIAEYMRDRGVCAPKGGEFRHYTVDYFLRKLDTYAGYLLVNYRSETGRKQARVRGDFDPIITGDELVRIKRQHERRGYKRAAKRNPFVGVAYCAICNRPMSSLYSVHPTYSIMSVRCGRSDPYPHNVMHSTRKIERAVRALIKQLQDTPNAVLLAEQMVADASDDAEQRRAEIEARLSSLEDQRARLIDSYVRLGVLSEDDFVEQSRRIERETKALRDDLDRLSSHQSAMQQAQDRERRIEELRTSGSRMLDRAASDPVAVRQWLKRFLRIYIDKKTDRFGTRIVRFELL